jgi:hypothetical protein
VHDDAGEALGQPIVDLPRQPVSFWRQGELLRLPSMVLQLLMGLLELLEQGLALTVSGLGSHADAACRAETH